MSYYGDIATSGLVYLSFTTVDSARAPIVLTGSPAVSVYKDDGGGESTAGVTLSASFDSKVGLNLVKIDTSADGTFYAAGHDFTVVVSAGTVDGVSAIGYVVGTFSIENRSVGSGTAPTAEVVAAAVWNRLLSAITTTSSIGKLLKDDIDVAISTRASQTSVDTVDDLIDTEIATLMASVATILTRLPALSIVTGTVVADGGNTASTFKTDLSSSVDTFYKKGLLLFSGGALDQQFRKVSAYTGATKFVTMDEAFTATPANGANFIWINR